MEDSKKNIEWKKCPNCNGSIPENWKRHDKCGWEGDTGTDTNTETGNTEEQETESQNHNSKDNMRGELNIELSGSRITVTRKETRQIRDYENNTYSVSISRPVETVNRDEIKEMQKLAKEVIAEQKEEDGVVDK